MRPHRWQPTRLCHPWDSPGKNTGVGCHFLLRGVKVKSESEVAQSCLTPSDSHGLQPIRLLHPWDSPGKSTGVGCHCHLLPSTEEWIKNMWYMYMVEYYSALKKNEIMPFAATWMGLEIIILREARKRKNTLWYHLWVESKMLHKWHYLWNRIRPTDRTDLRLPRGSEVGKGRTGSLGFADTNYYM